MIYLGCCLTDGPETEMAPALTKILKNGHGIHLSSPPASRVDSDTRTMCTVELEPHMTSTDDGDLQKMWLNLCSFRPPDSCLPSSSPDPPVNPGLSAHTQTSVSQCEMVPLTSPGSLISFLSINKCQRESHQVASVFPGVTDMFLIPFPEHNSQEASLFHGQNAVPECGPDGGDVHHSSLSGCSSFSHGEITSQSNTRLYATQPIMRHEELSGLASPPPSASVQSETNMLNPAQLESEATLKEVVKEQLSRHEGLQNRSKRLQKRLEALLGDHAVQHCSQQLQGLKNHCQLGDVSFDSLASMHHGLSPPDTCSDAPFSWQDSSTTWPSFTEVAEFCDSSQLVLRGLQEALDSEATGSSSSDDEPDEDMLHGRIVSCERQWLEERAELSSRWSWLQLRLSELDGRIQQLVELHKNIRSTKGRVVLADPYSLTNRDIQPKTETTSLFCTSSDADAEPCSPTRLLHNIQRQSAQLSQIVNSLIPPLSFSPLSKQDGRRTFSSAQGGGDVFLSGSSKKRRLGTRRRFKADASCVCARTRPLVTYHKRKLFTLSFINPTDPQNSGKPPSTLSSSVSSSSCLCSSCDLVTLGSELDCRFRTHPLVPLSSDFPTCHYLQRVVAREEWHQRPLVSSCRLSSPGGCRRKSSTPKHNNYKYKRHARGYKRRVMDLSPIRSSGSAWSPPVRSSQRNRKRGRIPRLTDRVCTVNRTRSRCITDDRDELYQLWDFGESSDDLLEESYTHVTHNQTSQSFVRKRQGDGVYNIDNIVIPVSLSKVEKLQYKDILTPSWRVVDVQCLTEADAQIEGGEDWQVEDLSDDVFAQRHLVWEQKEKSRWSSWEKRTSCRRPTRSGSRPSGGGGGMCTSGEESSVEWSCAQLDSDEQPWSEEWLPQAPWEPRVFPLGDVEEASLSLDEVEVPSVWTESCSLSNSLKNSDSQLSPAQSLCATLPSHGRSRNCTSNGS